MTGYRRRKMSGVVKMLKPGMENWMSMSRDMYALGLDSAAVIWLRSMRIAAGGPLAGREAKHMVREKVTATIDFAGMVASGKAGVSPKEVTDTAINYYGKKVRANRKRLSQK